MIELIDVTQHYSVRPVLKRINLRVERGELVVVVGPNGMGKSTLLGVMGGTLSPQRGLMRIDGRFRKANEEDELAIRRMTVYLPDQPWLPAHRTAREFVLSVGELYDVPFDQLFRHVEGLLELFELAPHAEQPIRSLSSGQKKKVALCAALITDVPVLLLDEPEPMGAVQLRLGRRGGRSSTCIQAGKLN